ncbi:hydrogenase 3 maturation endopeptidase HyCI [Candidatus Bipolaricaulota bacterium]|nr:hydrogenase 3 maturation endopeptidase HyCI [Candidatus Bipolaricaulota bacterium]
MKRMLLGVGNRLSHDDGVGPVVAQALIDSDWIAIDCGTALENAMGIVSREQPDLLVIVDAATMDKEPGAFYLLPIAAQDCMLASTHGLPLSFVLGTIEHSAKETVLVGVQPEDMSFGEGLSSSVEASSKQLVKLLRGHRLNDIPRHESHI